MLAKFYCLIVHQSRAAEDYRLIFRAPSNCIPADSQSACDIFVGIGTNTGNSSYLDIYLEGQADGWVAVGFSKTSNMVSNCSIHLKHAIIAICYNNDTILVLIRRGCC